MLAPADLTALLLTLRLALFTTVLLLLIGAPLAWWLARSRWRGKFLLEALVALPLVLPPTVLGFYLLLALSPRGWFGQINAALGFAPWVFSFKGLVAGSVVYSLPFVVQPLQDTFQNIGTRPLEVAATLRAGPWDRFVHVVLPMARAGFITAAMLGFAHTLGEFGVVLMLGGNIPGLTQVLSIRIYDQVAAQQYAQAHVLSAALLLLSFAILLAVYGLRGRLRFVR
ncbi:MAG: molybdate ABC transporter permease subunit [Pseudomonadales bacterium]|jgi:molybdate transport system permease protein|nr:molybdate ABC transporter permease subunit [Pseudomonadales bacterium]